jgi:sugar fermentation stimulation protein A
MNFARPLLKAVALKRYKRFFLDAELPSGETITCYMPNTGSLLSCLSPGDEILIEDNPSPERKLRYTVFLINHQGSWVGVHTGITNSLVAEALEKKVLKPFEHMSFKREVKIERSRFDFYLWNDTQSLYLEVKNVTLSLTDGVATFPDAVTTRGLKHLEDLSELARSGKRAACLYFIQRQHIKHFTLKQSIDPNYYQGALEAKKAGVEFFALKAAITESSIHADSFLPVHWD